MAKVLIVDDNQDMLDTLEHLLHFYDFEVVRAVNGKEALELASAEKPSLIILDALMPVMDGFEACEKLKTGSQTRDIPVIFLSANYTENKYRDKGFEIGADEYMLKPFNAKELVGRVNRLLNHRQLMEKLLLDNRSMLDRSGHQPVSLKSETAEYDQSQVLDSLTGLYNHIYFQECLKALHSRSLQEEPARAAPIALILADVDDFRQVNNLFGEYSGDFILMNIANVILNSCNTAHTVFRLDRNRFALLFAGIDENDCFYEAERLRSAVSQTAFFDNELFRRKQGQNRRRKTITRLTVSAGLASGSSEPSPARLLRDAEKALQSAKARGKNITVRYTDLAL